jgi:hypothetical protein
MLIQLHQCKSCKTRVFSEYTLLRTESYGPGGMYERRIYGRINEFDREVMPRSDFRACPTCKQTMGMKIIQGSKTETPCDDRCTEAKGHKCECSCGGLNHGRAA